MSCAALSLELERHSLTLCYYVYLSCPNCGELRAAIEEIPTDRFLPCPSCRQKVEYKVLAEGGTARPLPFWERAGRLAPDYDVIEAFWSGVQARDRR
jgi:hypothetical protein